MDTIDENCKYVAVLANGTYIYAIEETQILTCKSRLRARQFNPTESRKLARLLKVRLLKVDWEHVDTPTK
jgi:hypothetical protein